MPQIFWCYLQITLTYVWSVSMFPLLNNSFLIFRSLESSWYSWYFSFAILMSPVHGISNYRFKIHYSILFQKYLKDLSTVWTFLPVSLHKKRKCSKSFKFQKNADFDRLHIRLKYDLIKLTSTSCYFNNSVSKTGNIHRNGGKKEEIKPVWLYLRTWQEQQIIHHYSNALKRLIGSK